MTSLQFDGERPVSAEWQAKNGTQGTIAFDYLVDASGRDGIISTKYLKNRVFTQTLKNIAQWGYWTGGGVYGVGTWKEGSPIFEALTGQFPLLHEEVRLQLTVCRRDRLGLVYPPQRRHGVCGGRSQRRAQHSQTKGIP